MKEDRLNKKTKLTNKEMLKIISLRKSSKSVLAQAMERRSKKNGIDYEKLYFGTDEEKRKEKLIQEKNYKRQSLESWTEDDSI